MDQLGITIREQLEVGASGDELDLMRYWNIIWRDKFRILGLMLAVGVLTFILVRNMTPIYRSSATLLIEAKEANVVSIEEVYGIDSSMREYFSTQFEILNSRHLAEEVIREHSLDTHPALDPRQRRSMFEWRRYLPFLPEKKALSEEEVRGIVLQQFRNNLTIQPIKNTQLVRIEYESSYPSLTHVVANELGEAYIENNLESRLSLTQKAADWLTQRLGGMRDDLERAERELQAFRERENLVDVSGVTTLSTNEIEEISQRLIATKNRATELKSQYEAVGSDAGDYSDKWETLPGVLSNQLAQRLKESEATASQALSELSQRYGPKHPKRIAAQSNYQEARSEYRRQVRKVVGGFQEAFEQALADQRELESALANSKNEIQGINRKKYELSQLEREVQASRQLYELFFTRFKETNTADFAAANARFVDHAIKPLKSVKPRKTVILLVSLFLAGVLGVLLAFLREMLDNTVKAASEVEAKLHQPVIGVLPRVQVAKHTDFVMSEAVLYEADRSFAEAVRTARTSVTLSGIDKPLKRLVVTSSIPGEGKTTMSMNLAFAFGQLERVVLVDADMRRPSIASNCQLDPKLPGLSNIIAGEETLDACTQEYKGIDVITAGLVPPNPLELLSSKKFDDLLKVLSDKYDRVIIDSAPTQAVSDSLILSTHVDGVIYVVKSDATTTDVALNGLQRLDRVNAHILGVILNQFDAKHAARYGGYGRGYYDYYGYGSTKSY